jgi:hypothetical protein
MVFSLSMKLLVGGAVASPSGTWSSALAALGGDTRRRWATTQGGGVRQRREDAIGVMPGGMQQPHIEAPWVTAVAA